MNKIVTIVIPCLNEEKYIEQCLQSIIICNYPKHLLEVFVCDGLSEDNSQNIVKSIVEKHPFVRLLINEKKTTPYALNLGVNNASGDIIIILGAHSEIAPDYVIKCVETLDRNKNIGCAGGLIESISENDDSAIIAKAMSSPFGVGNAHFRTGSHEGYVDTVAFGAYKKEVFKKTGYFDEELNRNQDDEFNYRLVKNGYKIYLNPAIRARYYVRSSYKKMFRQYYQYGFWKVFVNRKHGAITTFRQVIPAFFVSFLFLGFVLSLLNKSIGVLYLSGVCIYIIFLLFGSFQISKSANEAIAITYSFFLLHLSYGLGYIEGILHFFILDKKPFGSRSISSR